jgi:uncharacterized membrane protein YraQ (UPF0718 family)
MTVLDLLGQLVQAGWLGLLDYLAAHVLLCLVPAFFIAGYLSGLLPQGIITRYLGPKTPKWISYPASAIGGFLLAVCSCTILPLFAGIWKRGAGLGPAITFLLSARRSTSWRSATPARRSGWTSPWPGSCCRSGSGSSSA